VLDQTPAVTVLPQKTRPHEESFYACPVCQDEDRSQKVSSVVRSGGGSLIWTDGEVVQYETHTAQLLREPEFPAVMPKQRVVLGTALSWLAMGGILGIVALLDWQTEVVLPQLSLDLMTVIAVLWFGFAVPGILLGRYHRLQEHARQIAPACIDARARWTKLYYCFRDDVVFVPGENVSAPPDQMMALLFDYRAITPITRQEDAIGTAV
jgi:hypothetical protein